MNIYAEPGTKVTYDKLDAGYEQDQRHARVYLNPGEQYTVDYTIVHSWSSEVYLKEIPGHISFNTVMFSDDSDMKVIKKNKDSLTKDKIKSIIGKYVTELDSEIKKEFEAHGMTYKGCDSASRKHGVKEISRRLMEE